jgi:hypothetical protein
MMSNTLPKVSRLDEKAEWLKGYLIGEQEGDTKNPACTQSELEARRAMAEKFSISEDWAYELIRRFVKYYPQLHLQKVPIEFGGGKKRREWELTWIEED